MPCVEMHPGRLPEGLTAFQQYQVYNCLDSCVTAQLVTPMRAMMNENQQITYNREMRVQSLCLDMSRKGFPIDPMAMLNLVKELDAEAAKALRVLHFFCDAVWAPRMNPNSWQQVEVFFYDFLNLPPIWKYDHKTKQRKRGTDRDSLEKLRDNYPSAQPFVNAILAYREAVKLAGVFKKGLEPGTGRLRCNFSPSGTKTGRLSSQTNPFGRGTNAQNLNDRVRRVVTAPAGFLIAYPDLKTAESIGVGFLSGDRAYISACLSGDLHTSVAALTWRELPWTGDLKKDKAIAKQIFYRDFDYRDMAKRGGHGTNYYGTPRTMAMHLKVPTALMEAFQASYFAAFPGIPEWQLEVIARVQQDGYIVTPMRRERWFWGRRSDPSTHREAIAHGPQSMVADVMNEGLMQVQDWLIRECDYRTIMAKHDAGLLAQIHDAGGFLIPIDGHKQILPEIIERMIYPVDFGELGVMRIPVEMSVGKNWGKAKDANPLGLKEWVPGQQLHFLAPPRPQQKLIVSARAMH